MQKACFENHQHIKIKMFTTAFIVAIEILLY